jgi:hypothetical protein
MVSLSEGGLAVPRNRAEFDRSEKFHLMFIEKIR